ncbi:MAG: hypothetical protein AAF411_21735 [Myxococcota bacterium]
MTAHIASIAIVLHAVVLVGCSDSSASRSPAEPEALEEQTQSEHAERTVERAATPASPDACDPSWVRRGALPTLSDRDFVHFDNVGPELVVASRGYVAISSPDGWASVDHEVMPALNHGNGRRTGFVAVHARADDDVYVIGTRMTVLHWDGNRWEREYINGLVDDYYGIDVRIHDDSGKLLVRTRWNGRRDQSGPTEAYARRGLDGAWGAIERAQWEASAAPPEVWEAPPRPDLPCYAWGSLGFRWVFPCRDVAVAWSRSRREWIALPADRDHHDFDRGRSGRDGSRRHLEVGPNLLLALREELWRHGASGWTLDATLEEPIDMLTSDEDWVHLVTEHQWWSRRRCPPPPAPP